MTGRLIPWLAVVVALSAGLPAIQHLKDGMGDTLESTEREVDYGVRWYFAREIRNSTY